MLSQLTFLTRLITKQRGIEKMTASKGATSPNDFQERDTIVWR